MLFRSGEGTLELGDYDNVLGYLEQRGAESAGLRSGERKGSYADMQRLRNESRERLGLSVNGAAVPAGRGQTGQVDAEADGIHLRRRTDVRKEGAGDS